MDEKLKVDMTESTEEKPDISHIPNSMFDQNVNSFTEGETMNRDYLNSIYGENMDFLNKEVRLTRTKYYEMREKEEKRFSDSIKQERKRLAIFLIVYAIILVIALSLILMSFPFFEIFMDLNVRKYFEGVEEAMLRGSWSAGGFFFGVGWMLFTISTSLLGAFIYSTIKNINQYKENRERALKNLEESKYEQMLLGRYDASR